MRSSPLFAVAVLCATLPVAMPSWGQESSNQPAATREEVEQLRNEVASQRQTIEALKAAVDQLVKANTRNVAEAPALRAGPVAADKANTANAAAPPSSGVAAVEPVHTGDGMHGFFERKPGSRMTFYVPGGELTTYGNFDVSFDVITKGLAGKIGPDGNPPVGNMGWMPDL